MRTAASASAVVRPAIIIIRRTRANNAACSGVGSGRAVSVMQYSVFLEGSVVNDSQHLLEVVVAGDEGSSRLDRVLATRCPELSRSRLKVLILDGRVAIAGSAVRDPAYHASPGETITIDVPPPVAPEPEGEAIALQIVHEDDDIIVIDKPRGLVVHPAAGHETGTLVNALIAHCGASLSGIGGVRRPGIVHRLDKDTTGLMVAAKNDRAHQSLSAQFADHGRTGELRRGYYAFVWGVPNRARGTIEAPIDRHPYAREKMAVRDGGREAITHWEVLETFTGRSGGEIVSLIACQLETGRTHQIRVHLAHMGHPLLGDDVYGPHFKTKASQLRPPARAALTDLGRQALHAYLLVVEHPSSGEVVAWESGLPADLARLKAALSATE
ncbi:RluA family pseudouridine synthase [Rhodopseudomonas palustris]|uniref:RluA family pseudouridine synthase n=1 Tax=Rhodopseudomonas palustris TaxID=1076 RepID=UPI003A0FD962